LSEEIGELKSGQQSTFERLSAEMGQLKSQTGAVKQSVSVLEKLRPETRFKAMELYFRKVEKNSELMECKFKEMEESWRFDFQSKPLTWQPELATIKALTDGVCTRAIHDKRYVHQPWYHCRTCKLVGNLGCCAVCAKSCHCGHDVVGGSMHGKCFCDCGDCAGSCQCRNRRRG
jgi:hypothetical protein